MPSITRTFITRATPDQAFEYLRDFTRAEEWDPGTQSCERTSGDGGVGTTYRNVSGFLGRTVEVTYTTEELEPGAKVHFVGRNDQFEGHDELGFRASGDGAEVTYHAVFSFRGGWKAAAPLVALYLPLLAKETVDSLRASLDRQAD